MIPSPLVLDANVFRNRDFLTWLQHYRGEKIVPAVAHAEMYVYYVGIEGRTSDDVQELLRRCDIVVEPLDKVRCEQGAVIGIECGKASGPEVWGKHWKDFLIGGHARFSSRIVVTENIRDFGYMGSRVMNTEEVMDRYPVHYPKRRSNRDRKSAAKRRR